MTYNWYTHCHANESKCGEEHNEEDDPESVCSSFADNLISDGYYTWLCIKQSALIFRVNGCGLSRLTMAVGIGVMVFMPAVRCGAKR